jgi:hypothetical protein
LAVVRPEGGGNGGGSGLAPINGSNDAWNVARPNQQRGAGAVSLFV